MRTLVVALLAGLLFQPANASTVSPVSVPLSKVVSESQLIVVGSVERITMLQPANTTKNDPGLRYFEVRIDEVLKGADQAMVRSEIVPVFDPREMFYHEHADMIAAGVISLSIGVIRQESVRSPSAIGWYFLSRRQRSPESLRSPAPVS
jgi:hypothetical protein